MSHSYQFCGEWELSLNPSVQKPAKGNLASSTLYGERFYVNYVNSSLNSPLHCSTPCRCSINCSYHCQKWRISVPFSVGRRPHPTNTRMSIHPSQPGACLENDEHVCVQVHTYIYTHVSVPKRKLTAYIANPSLFKYNHYSFTSGLSLPFIILNSMLPVPSA